jgi:predicted dehydrogenase
MTVKVALIGAGYMAAEHAKAFRDISGVQLSGIYSRTRIRSEAFAAEHSVKLVCDSVDQLHDLTQADLVVIAVSELSVREVCIAAFRHPWKCLVEKPAGYDVSDAECVLDASSKYGRQAYVGLNRRHYSSTRAVIEDLKNHPGQRLVHILDQESPRAALESGQPRTVVENWMYANSLHLVDYFSMVCRGELVTVDNYAEWRPGEPCFVVSRLIYSSRDIGIYEAVWEGPGPWAVTVTTHTRRWELRPLEQAHFQDPGSRKNNTIPIHPWDTLFKAGLRRQAEEAIRAIRDEPHRLPSLREGLESMNIVRKIYGR